MEKNNFCGEPWKQIFIGPDSKVKTCCSGRVPIGNLQNENINDILNSPVLKEIKESIINNTWHKNCGLCKELEESGIESQRKRTESDFLNHEEKYFQDINYHVPEMIDIRWDNTCNLACNYCMPYFSSTWASIKKEYQQSPRDNDGVIEYLKQKSSSIKQVLLLGGEPFLQKKNLELMEILSDEPSLFFITNLSFNLEKNELFKKILEKRNHVGFGISFETIGEKFEYVRHNADWNIFSSNLKELKQHFKEIKAMPLYCIYSAFNLIEYYDFIVENDLEIRWQKIEGPVELNVSLLPKEYREKAIKEINNVIKKYGDRTNLDIETLLSVKESLNRDPTNIISLEKVKNFHNTLETQYHIKKNKFMDLWAKELEI